MKAIILTGTSGAGKTEVQKQLITNFNQVKKVISITTRARRADDIDGEYRYISEVEYNQLKESNKFMIMTSYRDKRYGITYDDFNIIQRDGYIPVLVITPEACNKLYLNDSEKFNEYTSIFIDNDDCILDSRLKSRDNLQNIDKKIIKQRNIDREYKSICIYNLKSEEPRKTAELILELIKSKSINGVLVKRLMSKMMQCDMLLERAEERNIQSASYDLRLGDEYYYKGKIMELSDKKPIMEIEPYDYVIASCEEIANIPRNLVGRFDIKVNLFCQGVILSNGPQIDPGFKGKLFCLLFNTSNKTVYIKRREHYATIEFHKLMEPTEPYKGHYNGKVSIIEYIPSNAMVGAINELKKEIEILKKENKTSQNIFLGVIGLIFAMLSVILVFK